MPTREMNTITTTTTTTIPIRLKLKISKILPSFRSCRSKHSSTLPINPVPFHSPSSIGCGLRSKSISLHPDPPNKVTNSSPPEKWHVVAKLYSTTSPPPSPRRKIYDSSAVFPKHIRRRFDMNKKSEPRLRISISSADTESGLFSSEETDSTATRKKVKRKSFEFSPARLSLFKGLIPSCVVEGKVRESYAVVKRSENPYEDFRRSMMEMILEKKMFEERELEQLLDCFLSLNSRDHHGVIVQVFYEIWEALFSFLQQ